MAAGLFLRTGARRKATDEARSAWGLMSSPRGFAPSSRLQPQRSKADFSSASTSLIKSRNMVDSDCSSIFDPSIGWGDIRIARALVHSLHIYPPYPCSFVIFSMNYGHMGEEHNMGRAIGVNTEKRIALVKNIKKI